MKDEYDKCVQKGAITPKAEVDNALIKSLLEQSTSRLHRIKLNPLDYEKKTQDYSFLLVDHYEVLRMLIDAFIQFDKISIENHLCSNAYLCQKHPELECEWSILDAMRKMRNNVNYRGEKISEEQWKQVKFPFSLYISTLQKEIKRKLA